MSKLGNVRPKDVLRALEKHGFIRVKTVGSHIDLEAISKPRGLRHSGKPKARPESDPG